MKMNDLIIDIAIPFITISIIIYVAIYDKSRKTKIIDNTEVSVSTYKDIELMITKPDSIICLDVVNCFNIKNKEEINNILKESFNDNKLTISEFNNFLNVVRNNELKNEENEKEELIQLIKSKIQ